MRLHRIVFFCTLLAPQAVLAQTEFPFESELILEAAPMTGSKRVPNLEIGKDGAVTIEMWCNRVDAQLVVAGETITVLAGPRTQRNCTPEQQRADDELMMTLMAVNQWQRSGDTLTLLGPQPLKFKLPSN